MRILKVIMSNILLLTMLAGGITSLKAATDSSVTVALTKDESIEKNSCTGTLEVVGIGRAPQGRGKAQGKLLAERAAKLRAYRNLISAVDRLGPVLEQGSGIVSTTGFIRGVRIVEKNYLPDGRVQVKLALDVHFPESKNEVWIIKKVKDFGVHVCTVDRKVEPISEEAWVEWNK